MKNWRLNGLYYVKWWGFSINEGRFPNLHMSWRAWFSPFIYVALTPRLRWSWRRK